MFFKRGVCTGNPCPYGHDEGLLIGTAKGAQPVGAKGDPKGGHKGGQKGGPKGGQKGGKASVASAMVGAALGAQPAEGTSPTTTTEEHSGNYEGAVSIISSALQALKRLAFTLPVGAALPFCASITGPLDVTPAGIAFNSNHFEVIQCEDEAGVIQEAERFVEMLGDTGAGEDIGSLEALQRHYSKGHLCMGDASQPFFILFYFLLF